MGRIFYSNIFERYRAGRYILFPDDYKIRKGIPALPYSKSHNSVARPKSRLYPKELKTIGDHIRAWRITSGLLQKDAARILSVCEDTVVGWEMRGTKPTIRQMPRIIKAIGYLPLEINTSTLGGKITEYRYLNGLTSKGFGKLVLANGSTVLDWESGECIPSRAKRNTMNNIFSKM